MRHLVTTLCSMALLGGLAIAASGCSKKDEAQEAGPAEARAEAKKVESEAKAPVTEQKAEVATKTEPEAAADEGQAKEPGKPEAGTGVAEDKAEEAPADAVDPAGEDAGGASDAGGDLDGDADGESDADGVVAGEGDAGPAVEPTGPAWFAVAEMGLVRLADGEFVKAVEEPNKFKDMVVAEDGTIYVAGYVGIHRIEARGKRWRSRKIGDFRNPGTIGVLALGRDGTLWAAGFKGIAHWDGKKWHKEDKSVLGADVKLIKDIAAAPDGRVWVASSNAIHVRAPAEAEGAGDGEAGWKTLDLKGAGGGRKLFFESVTFAEDGKAYLAHSSGLLAVEDGEITEVPLGRAPIGLKKVRVAADGTLVLQAFKEIIVVAPDGAVKRISGKSGDMEAQNIEAIDVDARGRIWAATDLGVAVVDADGKVTEWPQGSVPALTGSVKLLHVSGRGPDLPQVGPIKTGKVTGKILEDGAPVKGAGVEICKRPASMFRKSPCADAPWKATAKTGDDGVFTFSDVPLGTYRFAIEHGGKWATGWTECCSGMKEGQTFDAGTLTLKNRGK